jgi:polysaccharide export outer membrane protein
MQVWTITARSRVVLRWLTGALATACFLPAAAAAEVQQADYLIGPGDVVQVFVWKEADLTRDVTVRSDGKMTLPLLGDVHAAGRTPLQLAQDLEARFGRFVGSPQVTVGVTQPNSRRVFVVGQVARAGAFPLIGPTTFLQALALAGGFQQFAKSDKVIVVRQSGGSQSLVHVDYKKIESGTDVDGQNIFLEPGDTVVVP